MRNEHESLPIQEDKIGKIDDLTEIIDIYFAEPKAPLLSPEEERDLAIRAENDSNAFKQFCEANTGLVSMVAKRFVLTNRPFLDIIQDGNEGLVKATKKFDPARGNKFSTYATWYIFQSIQKGLNENNYLAKIPNHCYTEWKKIDKERSILSHELGRDPTIKEIAGRTGISRKRINELAVIFKEPIRLDREVGKDNDDITIGDLIEDKSSNTVESAENQLVGKLINQVISEILSEREIEIIKYRYGFLDGCAHTLEETGKILGTSRQRIEQIEKNIFKKIGPRIKELRLDEFI